jgi:hypothetical protein
MHENELRDAFKQAVDRYEALKAGGGSTVEAFVELLVAERALISHIAGASPYGPAAPP